jgi:hypothetical protein
MGLATHSMTSSAMASSPGGMVADQSCRSRAIASPRPSYCAGTAATCWRSCRRLPDLRQQIGDDVALADESEIKRLFPDCALGAVPSVGECYDLDVIVDDSIQEQPDVYLEGGDYTTLIHISQAQFTRLMSGARHGRFSVHD